MYRRHLKKTVAILKWNIWDLSEKRSNIRLHYIVCVLLPPFLRIRILIINSSSTNRFSVTIINTFSFWSSRGPICLPGHRATARVFPCRPYTSAAAYRPPVGPLPWSWPLAQWRRPDISILLYGVDFPIQRSNAISSGVCMIGLRLGSWLCCNQLLVWACLQIERQSSSKSHGRLHKHVYVATVICEWSYPCVNQNLNPSVRDTMFITTEVFTVHNWKAADHCTVSYVQYTKYQ